MHTQIMTHIGQWLAQAAPAQRLPSIRSLALHWHCSPSSVRNALKPFTQRGDLVSRRGKGTFARGPLEQPIPPAPRSSAEKLYQALLKDISSGRLKQKRTLPSVKQVCATYSVSPATVAKAFRALVRDGLVVTSGRTYRVEGSQSRRQQHSAPEVYHFRSSVYMGTLSGHGTRTALVLSETLYELAQCGARVIARPVEDIPGCLAAWTKSRIHPLGIIVEGFSKEQRTALREPLTRFMRQSGTTRTAPVLFTDARRFAVRGVDQFCDGNFHTARARAIAAFVHAKAYTSLAVYLTLQQGFAFETHFRESLRIIPQLLLLGSAQPFRFYVDTGGTRLEPSAIIERLTNRFSGPYIEALLSKHGGVTLDRLQSAVRIIDGFASLAADVPAGSLCILRDQLHATAARDWCRAHGVSVPGTLALLEASADCFDLGSPVSSCCCDWRLTGYLIAHVILRDIPVDRTTKGFIPARAVILERETT